MENQKWNGLAKDQQCWYWVMYCSGDGSNCQRLCGGIGKSSVCRLSWLSSENPLRITIQGTHSIYKEVGYNKAKAPMMLMNRFEVFRVVIMGLGYISLLILQRTNLPIKPHGFYLRSSSTLRLIQENHNNNITLEDARKILTDSVEFGVYMHSDEIDIDNSLF
ncbi:hypothetical protein RclHR1_02890011 [Rhizophagus clarus]|uniref:Uncharacterized protein n=1 Tax=Rhizophagus clarus TaxID=94130 RepID=A0A2Z6RG38_9GLOM|nr:hypothetical protein RclHR1_02890011 [Rhizophagus clarus]